MKNHTIQLMIQSKLALKKYKKLAKNIPNIIFGGRLADYAYYDMDMTISAALQKFEKLKKDFFVINWLRGRFEPPTFRL